MGLRGADAMSLYLVEDEGESVYVEAPTFGRAIVIWRKMIDEENASDPVDPDYEPDSVLRVSEEPVLRERSGGSS